MNIDGGISNLVVASRSSGDLVVPMNQRWATSFADRCLLYVFILLLKKLADRDLIGTSITYADIGIL